MKCVRCPLDEERLTDVLGHKLCQVCAFDVREAVMMLITDGRPVESLRRAHRGERMSECIRLIEEHGYVDSKLLSKLTGKPRPKCTWYLHSRARQGKLAKLGRGRFGKP